MVCRMSTKCSDAEISCRMSTTATRLSRSRCSSATRARRRGSSSGSAGAPELSAGFPAVAGPLSLGVLLKGWLTVRGCVRVEFVAVESNDTIPAGFLCHVQRVVRGAHQAVAVRHARMRPSGHAEACRPTDRPAVEHECMRLDGFAHPFGEGHRRVEYGAGQQHDELLAAVTA